MNLKNLDSYPPELLTCEPKDLLELFGDPCLIHLKGKRKDPVFVSMMLHGNEATGLRVVQKILKKYGENLPRDLSILVGNVYAAKDDIRMVPGGLDYNRIWAGGDAPENKWAKDVIEEMRSRNVFALIDIHNNTGKNPYYGCVNKLDAKYVYLASLFKNTVIYFTEPSETLSVAMTPYCPSTTIECGLSGEEMGVQEAFEFVDTVLHLDNLDHQRIAFNQVSVYHSVAKIVVPEESKICFGENDGDSDFCFPANFDYFNFSELDENELLGMRFNDDIQLLVFNDKDKEVGDEFLIYEGNEIRLRKDVIPSMFTKDIKVIFQDCLGYLMERISWNP